MLVRDLVQGMEEIEQSDNTLYVTAVNEFGIKRYCMRIQCEYQVMVVSIIILLLIGSEGSSNQHYQAIIVRPTENKNLALSNLRYHHDHSTCFCRASCPTHNFQYFILPGLCLGNVLLVLVMVWVVVLYCQSCNNQQHCHSCVHVDTESGRCVAACN